jgi:8-oxo-dGTP diphosphatase
MTFDPYSSDYFDGAEKAEEQMKKRFANAVKALIVRDGKLLVLKNALDDPFRAGELDFPGGRLEFGENPYQGLIREIGEELGQDAADNTWIMRAVDVAHFTRQDEQVVTMMFFYCDFADMPEIKLSPEHSSYEWLDLNDAVTILDKKRMEHPSYYAIWRATNMLYEYTLLLKNRK